MYRKSGKTAPVFNDKHLSWSWDHAREMVDTARDMGFGLMAGSSPPGHLAAALDRPAPGRRGRGGGRRLGRRHRRRRHPRHRGHAVHRRAPPRGRDRRAGRPGPARRGVLEGPRVRRPGRRAAGTRDCSKPASAAAISSIPPGRPTATSIPRREDLRRLAPDPYAYRFEYADGLRATIIQFQPRRGRRGRRGRAIAASPRGSRGRRDLLGARSTCRTTRCATSSAPWSTTSRPCS